MHRVGGNQRPQAATRDRDPDPDEAVAGSVGEHPNRGQLAECERAPQLGVGHDSQRLDRLHARQGAEHRHQGRAPERASHYRRQQPQQREQHDAAGRRQRERGARVCLPRRGVLHQRRPQEPLGEDQAEIDDEQRRRHDAEILRPEQPRQHREHQDRQHGLRPRAERQPQPPGERAVGAAQWHAVLPESLKVPLPAGTNAHA